MPSVLIIALFIVGYGCLVLVANALNARYWSYLEPQLERLAQHNGVTVPYLWYRSYRRSWWRLESHWLTTVASLVNILPESWRLTRWMRAKIKVAYERVQQRETIRATGLELLRALCRTRQEFEPEDAALKPLPRRVVRRVMIKVVVAAACGSFWRALRPWRLPHDQSGPVNHNQE